MVAPLRVLQIHCYEFSYRVRKETPVAERPPHTEEDRLEDVLVYFTCFEKQDEGREEEIIERFAESLRIDVSRVGCGRVLLYPYAHLSKSLGSPRLARGFMARLRDRLSTEGIEAHRSPFGWYKSFNLGCIGHPLAEAYREF